MEGLLNIILAQQICAGLEAHIYWKRQTQDPGKNIEPGAPFASLHFAGFVTPMLFSRAPRLVAGVIRLLLAHPDAPGDRSCLLIGQWAAHQLEASFIWP